MQEKPPLHNAFLFNQRNLINSLIDQATDINEKDCDGDSALILASFRGWIDEIKLLLKKNADINITDSAGNTPIILIVGQNHQEAFEYVVINSDIKQLNLFKEQLFKSYHSENIPGFKKILKRQYDKSLEFINKIYLHKNLQISLIEKKISKSTKV